MCGAGTGVPKSGFSLAQYVGPAAIGGALAGLSGWRGAAVGAALGALSYDLSTFCPAGPAAFPTFTIGDIEALLSPFPLPGYATAYNKLKDFVDGLMWPVFCECSGGASTIGSPSTFPTDAPQQAPVTATSPVCYTRTFASQAVPQQNAVPNYFLGPTVSTTSFDLPVPTGAKYVTFTINAISAGATHRATDWSINQRSAAHTNLAGSISGTVGAAGAPPGTLPTTQTLSMALAADCVYLRGSLQPDSITTTDNWSGQIDIYCSGAPGQVVTACCPPDPNTQAMLDRILGLVTLIQRQAAPFAYVYGTQTTGLTGHGSISTSGLVGVSVDVTTLPSSYGRATGSPEALFDLGYVTLGTADGYEKSRRIDSDGTLFIPPSAGLYTAIGYTLSPGVEVAIRELVREP